MAVYTSTLRADKAFLLLQLFRVSSYFVGSNTELQEFETVFQAVNEIRRDKILIDKVLITYYNKMTFMACLYWLLY
jgi:hypothetical protein